jgi:rhomboid protease GluP
MAFGLTPTYSEHMYLDDLTSQQYLVIAFESVKKLGWNIRFISDTGIVANLHKGVFKWNAEVTIKIQDDHATLKSESLGSEIFDLGRNRRTINKFTDTFADTKYLFTPEESAASYEALKPDLTPPENDILLKPPPTTQEKLHNFFSILIPRKNFFITPLLVDINFVVFILMVISGVGFLNPDTESLVNWGANFRPSTLDGQWWRLVTNFFIHIGFIHLLFNMYALLYIGIILEPFLGALRFATAYMLCGILASLNSLYWHDLTISAGASGAIFGMYGIFLALLTTNMIEKTKRKALLISIAIFVFYNLANGLKGGIDNSAHLGGLISGIIAGYVFYPGLRKQGTDTLKYATMGLFVLFTLIATIVIYKKIPNDIVRYQSQMNKFSDLESLALGVYKLPGNAEKGQVLTALKDNGIDNWSQIIKLVGDADQLNLPDAIHQKDKKILEYCHLRLNSFQLMYKSVDENTNVYKDSLEYYAGEIHDVLTDLKNR